MASPTVPTPPTGPDPASQRGPESGVRRSRLRGDEGGIAIYTAVVTVALLGIIGLAIDGGGKLRATERADSVAMEAARAAGQAIDPASAVTGTGVRVDPQAAQAAAQAYLSRAGTQGTTALSADGTQLTVTVHDTYATRFLAIVGVGSMSVTGHGSARLLHGVTQPE
ncbi:MULTISPECIES: pilus assembly protein TadG-related protein [unclassified Streptomyces]|uniref:pilus assembly protein TadG-related protein n=1 Tax=unclassified Streptomyces TaxID=2593676 RepID=UPI00226F5F62|nr:MULTISPECIES: pilus assembly protein TadG-related protein [unclassified Streptomyces]MCY0923430.1 pilus assembly protein TadG-related protein [Streptomyces sp. H27-G5]MCY0961860.1 pilus assembly protein TadG-related protein [Streptomyces sp. H27-H5]